MLALHSTYVEYVCLEELRPEGGGSERRAGERGRGNVSLRLEKDKRAEAIKRE